MGSVLCSGIANKPVKVLSFGDNVETLNHDGVGMLVWEVGTRCRSRVYYLEHARDMDACIFVVDSADHEKFPEAVEEFFQTIVPEAEKRQAPILVLAKKQDIAGAMTPDFIRQEIHSRKAIQNDLEVFPTTALNLGGVVTAMGWLTAKMAAKLTRESYLSSANATLSKLMQYPASFVKSFC